MKQNNIFFLSWEIWLFCIKEIVQSSYKQIILNEFGNYQKTKKYLWTCIEFWEIFLELLEIIELC